jgi:hypothetical protein
MISILEEDNFELCSAWGYIIVRVMVFNVTFNNMLVISWLSVLLLEETGENHQPTLSAIFQRYLGDQF